MVVMRAGFSKDVVDAVNGLNRELFAVQQLGHDLDWISEQRRCRWQRTRSNAVMAGHGRMGRLHGLKMDTGEARRRRWCRD
jgi:hypothetical protein